MSELRKIDATPDPRMLKMLGEIPLKDWQCIAEFIDNSIDSFVAPCRVVTNAEERLLYIFPFENI